MKKIVIVTAVLTTTLVYDTRAEDPSKPISSDTVVDVVAVGKRAPGDWELGVDNTKTFVNANGDGVNEKTNRVRKNKK